MKQCFAYTRVSTIKQGEGVSLEAQQDAIRAYAERHDLQIVKWFEEKETAAKRGRPIFTAMIKQLHQRKAQGLVMHKIDRSARNFADWAKIGDLADAGIDIHFATESLDFHSRGGRLTADIQAVIAADYIRNLREETIKGIDGRLRQGLYPFRAPIGYLDQGAGKPKLSDPAKAPLIRSLFQRYAAGNCSINSLRDDMEKAGLRNHHGQPVSAHGIETILNNSFYCGLIHIKRTGASYDGIHEPLIAVSLFKQVQDVKAGRNVGKKVTRHNHTFRSLFRCAYCETAAIGERQKGHVYYRCHTRACRTKTVREEVMDRGIAETLRCVHLRPEKAESMARELTAWINDRRFTPDTSTLQARKKLVDTRLERLTDALLDSHIDNVMFNHKKQALLLEQAELEEKIAALLAKTGPNDRAVEEFVELRKSLYLTYQSAVPVEKRRLAKLTTSNRRVAGRSASVEPCKWLVKASNVMDTLYGDLYCGSSRTVPDVNDSRVHDFKELLQSPEFLQLTSSSSSEKLADDELLQQKR